MKTASVAHAKSHLSDLLATVAGGEEIIMTRRGKPAPPVPSD